MKLLVASIVLFLHISCVAFAQEISVYDLFYETYQKAGVQVKKDVFNGQVLKGKKNGMGILFKKNHSVYIGNFSDGVIEGTGMYLIEEDLPYCSGSTIYIGRWKGGKKNGKGRCYAPNGDLIYDGIFENDKPVNEYPSPDADIQRFFSVTTINDGAFFIGEYCQGLPDGYGIILLGDGDTIQGQFVDGERKGIGLYLTPSGDWQTQNVKNGEVKVVSSSENYLSIDTERKAKIAEYNQSIKKEFVEILNDAVQLASDFSQQKNSGSVENNTEGEYSSSGSGSTSRKSSRKSNNHTAGEVQSKNTDSNTYTAWESQLIKMNTYYETQYKDSGRREIQRKMKNIRSKWESRGFSMYHSSWEDWDGRGIGAKSSW